MRNFARLIQNIKNMKLLFVCIIVLTTTIVPLTLRAQGCSDAGFCTIQNIKSIEPADTFISKRNTLNVGLSFGESKYGILIFNPFVEYSYDMSDKVSFTARLLAAKHSGELGSVRAGLSDAMLTIGYAFADNMKFTGGFKLPLVNGNQKKNSIPLPMAYQNSLGTFDMIMGFSYKLKRWSFIAGYQQPIIQNNNGFLASDYAEDAPEHKYYSTRNYVRAGDVLLRISYTPVDSRRLRLITGVLPILHLFNDTYTDRADKVVEIKGSQGLTLNITAILQIKLNKSQILEITAGAPVISRDVRPDGLTKFGIGLEYKFRF